MARKGFNFINSFRNVFRRKHSNTKPKIEVQKAKTNTEQKVKSNKRRSASGKQYHGAKQKGNYLVGGCNDRNTRAIYYKPSRGKFKGYMREAS
jgi:hypothetical protein